MENTTNTTNSGSRGAAVSALAIVGFIVLIIIGIVLAIYTARRLPKVASKLNGASVSLSSIFNSDEKPALQVVTATSTLPFEETATTSSSTSTSTVSEGSTVASTHSSSAGASYSGQTKYVTVVTTQPAVAPYGNPDLSVNVTDVGYLSRGGDTSSFVGANAVPFGNNAAVKFTITNTGTNVTGPWNFAADIPISPSQHFLSPMQAPLNPGERVDFVLGFDRGYSSGQRITVTVVADPNNYINETTKNNNVSSRWIVIQ